jgi:dihydroorotate dehydrogenase (fumarate)
MDLTTTYLGLTLRNPLVASASPLSATVDGVRRLADGGVGAVVLPSLFEEDVRRAADESARLAEAGTYSVAEASTYFPPLQAHDGDSVPPRYLSLVERASAAVDIPVIASINAVTAEGWVSYAAALQDAGASALELNVAYLPGDPHVTGREVEDRQVEVLQHVRSAVTIPVAVKLSPFFSSPGEVARRLDEAGADGLVLFNRFMHPDVDLETLEATAGMDLSSPAEGRLPRAWLAVLSGGVRASLAGGTGVAGPEDVVKYLLAGADVVTTASALLRHGPWFAGTLVEGLESWLRRRRFSSVAAARGLAALPRDADAVTHERAAYVHAVRDLTIRYRTS